MNTIFSLTANHSNPAAIPRQAPKLHDRLRNALEARGRKRGWLLPSEAFSVTGRVKRLCRPGFGRVAQPPRSAAELPAGEVPAP